MKRFTFRGVVGATTLAMVIYTVLRAALVWGTLGSYGVNPWVFLALDVLTAPLYVWGLGKMGQSLACSAPLKMVVKSGLVVLTSFILPYVYLYVAGREAMPLTAKLFIGLVVAILFCAQPIRVVVKKVKIGKAC